MSVEMNSGMLENKEAIQFTNYPTDQLSLHILRLTGLHLKSMSDDDKRKIIAVYYEILGIQQLKKDVV